MCGPLVVRNPSCVLGAHQWHRGDGEQQNSTLQIAIDTLSLRQRKMSDSAWIFLPQIDTRSKEKQEVLRVVYIGPGQIS